jgi:hypothetical protein
MELLVYDAKAAKANIKSTIRNWHQLEEILLYRFVFNVKSRFGDPNPHWFGSWTDSGLGMRIRIQEQGNLPVLRIQNVYSGSRIRIFPSFRIKSLNYQIGTYFLYSAHTLIVFTILSFQSPASITEKVFLRRVSVSIFKISKWFQRSKLKVNNCEKVFERPWKPAAHTLKMVLINCLDLQKKYPYRDTVPLSFNIAAPSPLPLFLLSYSTFSSPVSGWSGGGEGGGKLPKRKPTGGV